MSVPHIGDVLIRNLPDDSYEVVDAVTRRHLAGPFPEFVDAMRAARELERGRGSVVWRQPTDARGRPLADPMPLPAML